MSVTKNQLHYGKCLVCGSTKGFHILYDNCEDVEYFVVGKWDFLCCTECGSWKLNPMPDKHQLVDYYPPNYHNYSRPSSILTRVLWYFVLRQKAKIVCKLIGSEGRFLDVGCADGYVIRQIEKHGNWLGSGVEINDKIAELGRKQGTDIQTGVLEDVHFPENYFDLIIMNHLLEHVTDPELTMMAAKRLLKPGGYILGEIPNTDSWDAALSGRFWGGLHTPRHLYLMNSYALKVLAERCGFEVINVYPSLHTGHWAGSVQNYFHRAKHGQNLKFGRVWYFPGLLYFFIPINILQFLLLKTGILGFVLRKRI